MATIGNTKEVIETLNSFLRGELCAVETYRQAIAKVKDEKARAEIQQCLTTHEQNVSSLRTRIQMLGGEPATGSGAWGTFARVVQAGADVLGDKTAIAALEEGEDRGLRDYRSGVEKLDTETRVYVERELLAHQQRTHQAMSGLKKAMA